MFDKFKPFLSNDTFFYSLLLVLIATISFGLGRLSLTVDSNTQQATVSYVEPMGPVRDLVNSPVVASKNGSKYHFLWCPGATQMKGENKLEFENAASAEAAGYELAGNCE